MTRGIDRALDVVSALAIALWLGGLVVLGAVVAPTVFRMVPAPYSADAMTTVFRRFDVVAFACAVVVLLAEVGRALVRKPLLRVDVARMGLACAAAAIVVFQATVLSPKIVHLHESGAIRGLGDAGLELESIHHLSETLAKTELAFLVGVVILLAARRPSS
jgi:uncharacterized membrane protein